MNIEYGREFIELARCLNFTETAGNLNMTQPALSKHVSSFEKEFGIELLDRDRKGLQLTEAGRVLFENASAMVEAYDRAVRQIDLIKSMRPINVVGCMDDSDVSALMSMTSMIAREKHRAAIVFSRSAGDPIELAQRYDEQRADEVIFLDITATSDKRETTVDLASRASAQLHLPYCVGGGFRSVADIRRMIAAGADKVSVNSAAVANPQLITDAAAAFGGQAILCAIDAKRRADNPNKWEVYVHGGRTATGIDAVEWAAEAARRGAGEILLTSMDRDGSKDGFDCALTRAVARAVDIPVIASGGVGKLEHFAEGIIDGEADAVLAASVFHFGEFTVTQVKEYMRSQGIPVRL